MSSKDCPTCGREFEDQTAMKIHHTKSHGESLAGVSVECSNCGDSFRKKEANVPESGVNYCSRDCLGEARKQRVTVECGWCNSTLSRKPHQIENRNNHFCNSECKARFRSGGSYKGVESECSNCGDEFSHPPSEPGTFCSHECLHSREMPVGGDHARWKQEQFTCSQCGETFHRAPSQARYDHVFCDLECRSKWQQESGLYVGENNPSWAGGYEPYYGPNWEDARRRCRERDDHTCQGCGVEEDELDQELSVHHITPFREFVPDEGGPDFEAANDLDNLVSLCQMCHKKYEGVPVRPEVTETASG